MQGAITDDFLLDLGFRALGCCTSYRRWLMQWNDSQFVTLYQRLDTGTWSLRYRGYFVQGLSTTKQLDDAFALLERWGVLEPRQDK